MTTRIGARFDKLRAEQKKGFIAFVTAGDPSLDRTVELAVELDEVGVDVLELGVPFSDPLADGPAIQRSSGRALAHGVTLAHVLDVVRRIRKRSQIPLMLFSYSNPLMRHGLERLVQEARDIGVDGVLVTDLPPEDGRSWRDIAWSSGLDTIFLAAPTSPPERLRRIVESSRGFVYAVSRIGITGERTSLSEEAAPLIERIRTVAPVPVALGFGISTPEQVAEAAQVADGVIVGSRLVRFLEEQPEGDLAAHVRWLMSGMSGRE